MTSESVENKMREYFASLPPISYFTNPLLLSTKIDDKISPVILQVPENYFTYDSIKSPKNYYPRSFIK